MANITRKQAEERLALPVLSLEEAVKRLDDTYELVYIDYRDYYEDTEIHQDILKTGFPEYNNMDWICDYQWESADYIMKELFEDADIEDIEDDLRMEICDRDVSEVSRQLLKNTPEIAAYYELGIETASIYGDEKEDMQAILKKLKTNKRHPSYKDLRLMNAQASYGGNVVFMFSAELLDFYGDPSKDPKYIVLDDPYIAIMDRFNGSGDFTQIKGTYTVPFDRKRLNSDEAAGGYSLIGKVFGSSPNEIACKYNLTNTPSGKIIE